MGSAFGVTVGTGAVPSPAWLGASVAAFVSVAATVAAGVSFEVPLQAATKRIAARLEESAVKRVGFSMF